MNGLLIENGDLVIANNEIKMTSDADLLRQTIQSVISTNKGEWLFDEEEGVEFDFILGIKEINEAIIKSEIQQALEQVDNTLAIDEFSYEYEKETRCLKVKFKAKKANGETVEVSSVWA